MSVKDKSIYELPTGDLKEELENIIAPDFYFTNESVYDCLFDIYSYLDAVPRLNENNELTITYLNNYSEEKDITSKFVGYNSKLKVDRYTNSLLTYYQNARIDNTCFTPNKYNFRLVSSNKVGVLGDSNEYKIITDNNIDYIIHLYLHFFKTISISTYDTEWHFYRLNDNTIIDFADTCLTNEVWSTLDAPDLSKSYGNENQLNRMHYKQGSKEIAFMQQTTNGIFTAESIYSLLVNQYASYLGISFDNGDNLEINNTPSPWEIAYQIEYKPQVKGIAKVESPSFKSNGEERISQANGGALLSKMGKNSLGQAIISGNPSRNVSVQVSSFNNRFKVGDYYTDNDNEKWVINKCTTTIYNDFCIQTLELTKNFNNLSSFIRQDKQKRFSEISSSIVASSKDFYTDYIYFSSNEISDLSSEGIHLSTQFIKQSLINTFSKSSETKCDLDLIALKPYVNNSCLYDYKIFNKFDYKIYISVPFYKYGYGNTINYEMGFDDAITGGTRIQDYDWDWFTTKYKVLYSRYADSLGFADSFDLSFRSSKARETDTYKFLPYIESEVVESNYWCGGFYKLNYYKKPNEIFGLNYQVCFLGNNPTKDLLGDYFIKNSSFITGKNESELYIYVNGNYSILDIKASGEELSIIEEVSTTSDINTGAIILNLGISANKDYDSWCVCDKDKNLVMAFNNPISKGDIFKIYFYSNKNRIK